MVSEKDRKLLKNNLVMGGLVIFVMITVPLLIGFGFSGFDRQIILDVFQTYGVFGIAGVLVVMMLYGAEILTKKGDDKYGNSLLFSSPGEPPAISGAKFFQGKKLILLVASMIFFAILGLFIGLQGQSFTGEVLIEQQFSPGGEILFRFFLIPLAENASVAGILAVFVFGWRIYARRIKMNRQTFMVGGIIILTIVAGVSGLVNHNLRYGDADISQIIVFFFWSAGGLFTGLVGSFIPFFAMHSNNNLFFDLQKQFSSDSVRIVAIIAILSMIAWLVVLIRRSRKIKDNGN